MISSHIDELEDYYLAADLAERARKCKERTAASAAMAKGLDHSSNEPVAFRAPRRAAQLRKKRGIWVYRVGEPLSSKAVENTLRRVRRELDKKDLGKSC